MYKLMTLGALLLGLALAPVLSGNGAQEEQDDLVELSARQIDARVSSEQGVDQPVTQEARTCEWQCEVCEPEQGCSQVCTEIGDCGSACDMVAQCDAEHTWDESTCACR